MSVSPNIMKFSRLKSFLCSRQKRGYTVCLGKTLMVNVPSQPSRQHLKVRSMDSV